MAVFTLSIDLTKIKQFTLNSIYLFNLFKTISSHILEEAWYNTSFQKKDVI
jgi:hypothetical protein